MNSVKSAFEMQVRACGPARRAYVAYCLAFLNLGACRYHRVGKMTVERLLAVIVAYTYEVTVAASAAAGARFTPVVYTGVVARGYGTVGNRDNSCA